MGRGSSSDKLERLDQLLGALSAGEANTASGLASALGVSQRTLMRDLDTLRSRGYPIESEPGRGGGVRLYPRWGIGRLALNYREVIDLLLALSVLEKMDSPLFLNHLSAVRNKLYASFPDAQRAQVRRIRQRLLIGELASGAVLQNYVKTTHNRHHDKVLQGFFDQQRLAIRYERADGERSERCIEIHYLFLNWPVWYLIAWDLLREAPRTFRIDRVLGVSIQAERFTIKKVSEFCEELQQFSQQL